MTNEFKFCCLILGGWLVSRRFMEITFPNYSIKHLPGCIKTFRGKNLSTRLYTDVSREILSRETTPEVSNGKIETQRDQNYLDIPVQQH